MKNLLILFLFFGVFTSNNAIAQIGIAVAKNSNNSAIEWRINWGSGSAWDCKMKAKKYLTNKGHQKVSTQDGNSCCGHNISSGYYVVVKSRYKIYDNSYKTSYGLGASSSSYSDAEMKAVKNLTTYNWSWKKRYGYSVEKKGSF